MRRCILFGTQGRLGFVRPAQEAPLRGKWGLRCSWRRCDPGKGLPEHAGQRFLRSWFAQGGGLTQPLCEFVSVLYVFPALSQILPPILGKSIPPRLIVSPNSRAVSEQRRWQDCSPRRTGGQGELAHSGCLWIGDPLCDVEGTVSRPSHDLGASSPADATQGKHTHTHRRCLKSVFLFLLLCPE